MSDSIDRRAFSGSHRTLSPEAQGLDPRGFGHSVPSDSVWTHEGSNTRYPLCLPILGLRTNHCSHQKRTSGTTHGQGDLDRAARVTIADLRSIAQSIGSLRPSDDLLHLTLKFQEILIILEVRWSWGNCRILSCMRG